MVPVDSPVHRLWAGTKLLAVAGVSFTLSWTPSWGAAAVFSALLVLAARLARVPWSAVPRPPRWFWIGLGTGAFLTFLSGGSPYVTIGNTRIGLGGIDSFALFGVISALLVGAGAMVGWTTPLGEIAPALARLGKPFRRMRLPVDEWAVAVALCVRSLPLLVGELRTLIAARRLRPTPAADWRRPRTWLVEAVELLSAALAAALRRSNELAEALTARGGVAVPPQTGPSPRTTDAIVIAVVALICAAVWLMPS
jgi:energy-coupling factor transport system permease protein